MSIPTRDYFVGNMTDNATDVFVIALLAAFQCSATTILLCWAISAVLGLIVTYKNAQKYGGAA